MLLCWLSFTRLALFNHWTQLCFVDQDQRIVKKWLKLFLYFVIRSKCYCWFFVGFEMRVFFQCILTFNSFINLLMQWLIKRKSNNWSAIFFLQLLLVSKRGLTHIGFLHLVVVCGKRESWCLGYEMNQSFTLLIYWRSEKQIGEHTYSLKGFGY